MLLVSRQLLVRAAIWNMSRRKKWISENLDCNECISTFESMNVLIFKLWTMNDIYSHTWHWVFCDSGPAKLWYRMLCIPIWMIEHETGSMGSNGGRYAASTFRCKTYVNYSRIAHFFPDNNEMSKSYHNSFHRNGRRNRIFDCTSMMSQCTFCPNGTENLFLSDILHSLFAWKMNRLSK